MKTIARYCPLVLAVGLTLVMFGCAGQPQTPEQAARTSFISTTEMVGSLYVASAQVYAKCHADAGTDRAEQDKCYEEKNQRGETLGEALPYLEAAGGAAIAYNGTDASGNLAQAHAIINALQVALQGSVSPDQAEVLGWMEGTQ